MSAESSSKRRRVGIDSLLDQVAEFHRTFDCPVLDEPVVPPPDRAQLRVALLQEEVDELRQALTEGDLVETADALADIQYVLLGAVHECGMGGVFQQLFDEVHRSNMTKLAATRDEAQRTVEHYLHHKNGTVASFRPKDSGYMVYRVHDNKTLKSVEYSPADVAGVLAAGRAAAACEHPQGPASPPSPTPTPTKVPTGDSCSSSPVGSSVAASSDCGGSSSGSEDEAGDEARIEQALSDMRGLIAGIEGGAADRQDYASEIVRIAVEVGQRIAKTERRERKRVLGAS